MNTKMMSLEMTKTGKEKKLKDSSRLTSIVGTRVGVQATMPPEGLHLSFLSFHHHSYLNFHLKKKENIILIIANLRNLCEVRS